MARELRVTGELRAARTFGGLSRMADFLRESGRIARTTGSLKKIAAHCRKIPALVSLRENSGGSGITSGADGGTESRSVDLREASPSRQLVRRIVSWDKALSPVARAMNRIGNNGMAKESRRATDALARVQRSVESASIASAIVSRSQRTMPKAGSNTLSTLSSDAALPSRSQENSVAERSGSSSAGLIASARTALSMRGVIPPSSVSRREFASLSRNGCNLGNSGHAGITIHSSPTVVINTGAVGGNLQRDVIGALRAHREELFDQLQRESVRRERAQF
jgi:hypothetical protein